VTLAEARALFSPETAYLNTAAYGLPPRPAFEALAQVTDQWRHGRTPWMRWQESVDVARGLFASLVGVAPEDVAVGTQVSSFVGLVALSLPAGARVVAAEEDFTSVLFPLLARSDLRVELVPLDELVNTITEETELVAVSAVQSADGRVADLDAIARAAGAVGALTLIDATQACGWLPFDATRFDYTVTATYKWLLAPRGCAFMTARRRPSGSRRTSRAGSTPIRRRRPTAGRCGWRRRRGGSTCHRRGSRGWRRRRRWRCFSTWGLM
jgi:selenocysteine lyase/cysteine desulfurase